MGLQEASSPELIESGQCYLGLELGSSRIKAVLIESRGAVLASGSHSWENSLVNGVWTYALEEVHSGLQAAYRNLKSAVQQHYTCSLCRLKALGVSAMMHGYLAFDAQGRQLAEFRTWRNTNTSQAAEKLSQLFRYNIPQRWSVAHLYQAMLNGEHHVSEVAHINTLAGYIHWRLSGRKLLGIGDASGMFPIDPETKNFDAALLLQFDQLHSQPWKLAELLPTVLCAGQVAGTLSAEGAAFLDTSGELERGVRLCAPEGDAGTGMVATNSVAPRTGNVSAGTSVFAMLVLERPLSRMRGEIDLVTTPDGLPVAMAHCNNGSSDIDAWIRLFGEAARALGANFEQNQLFDILYRAAFGVGSRPDCGDLLHYGYVAGEDLAGLPEGLPLFVREPGSPLSLANFMRSQLYGSLCALRIGLDILLRDEGVQIDDIRGHGGFFKTEGVGQRVMAAATNTPVTVLRSAGEGGAWGIALLAAYCDEVNASGNRAASLPEFLARIFEGLMSEPLRPDPQDVAGFERYFERFLRGLEIERSAIAATK